MLICNNLVLARHESLQLNLSLANFTKIMKIATGVASNWRPRFSLGTVNRLTFFGEWMRLHILRFNYGCLEGHRLASLKIIYCNMLRKRCVRTCVWQLWFKPRDFETLCHALSRVTEQSSFVKHVWSKSMYNTCPLNFRSLSKVPTVRGKLAIPSHSIK